MESLLVRGPNPACLFRFEPVRITAQRDLRNPANEVLQLVLEIAWEPRLGPISLKQPLADLKAVDAKGNPLSVDTPIAVLEVPVNPESAAEELILPLALPSREVKQIARLEGKLTALLPGRIETFRFENVIKAKNAEKRIASTTVVLEQTRRLNDDLWQVRMRVRFDRAGRALESHRGWIYDNEAYLEGPDRKPIPHEGFETTGRAENEVGVAYLFVLDGPPAAHTFVYKTPGAILSAEFEYEIRGVKLP